MAATYTRRRLVRTAAGAAALALAVSLPACTSVTRGTAVLGDPGPCAHVNSAMLDVPTTSSTQPQMRIPQPAGWESTTQLEDPNVSIRLAVADNVVDVMVESVPNADAQTIFDG